jgi:hypothetical protein
MSEGWAQARNLSGVYHYFRRGRKRCRSLCGDGRYTISAEAGLRERAAGPQCSRCQANVKAMEAARRQVPAREDPRDPGAWD